MTILFPQVVWDAQDLMFSMPEPGVYMLQMGGSISGANVVAKMVNDDVEAEVVTLEGTKDTVFRCRSTIFTVEDDDHEAERLLVEVFFVNIIILFAHTSGRSGHLIFGTSFDFQVHHQRGMKSFVFRSLT